MIWLSMARYRLVVTLKMLHTKQYGFKSVQPINISTPKMATPYDIQLTVPG